MIKKILLLSLITGLLASCGNTDNTDITKNVIEKETKIEKDVIVPDTNNQKQEINLSEEEKEKKIQEKINKIKKAEDLTKKTEDVDMNNIDSGIAKMVTEIKTEEIKKAEKKAQEEVVIEKLLDKYVSDIQSNKDITLLLNDKTITFVKNQLQKTLNKLTSEQKKIFYTELLKLGYDENKIDFSKDDNIREYINFIIKYPIKVNGKIKEYKIIKLDKVGNEEIYNVAIEITYSKDNKKQILRDIQIKNNKINLSNF